MCLHVYACVCVPISLFLCMGVCLCPSLTAFLVCVPLPPQGMLCLPVRAVLLPRLPGAGLEGRGA